MASQVDRWLDAQTPQMLTELTALCNVNSGSSHLAGLLAAARWLENWINIPEAFSSQVSLPARVEVDDSGVTRQVETGPLLRWDFRPQAKRRVLLAIHYDTVFGEQHAFQNCERLSEDRLQGPGVADAKGGIVVMVYALRALCQFDLVGDLGWTLVLNPDEELGSPSSTGELHRIAPEFDFGLLFEPALPSGELVSSRKGSGNFDLVVRGKAAHAGRHFEDGRNALALLSRLLVRLDGLNGQRDGVTLNVGYVHGGGAVNIVPDLAVGRFNVRMQNAESIHWVESQLDTALAEANAQDGFSVALFGGITSPPKVISSGTSELMKALETVLSDAGAESIQWTATGGVCDGNKLAAAGLPNIDTMGPIGGGLHSPGEWVQVSSLAEKAKVIVRLLSRYGAGEFPSLQRERVT